MQIHFWDGIIGMNIEYKKLTSNELDIFINMRINQLREEGAKEGVDFKS